MNDHSETDLISRLVRGDESAFKIIYKKYVGELFSYARRNIYVKEDCEEIVQEVFESLWKRREDLQLSSLRFYLLKMVKYKVIRYFQKSKVRQKYAEHFALFEAVYHHIQTDDEMLPDHTDIQALIDRSITALPQRCQVAFNMRLKENLSNSEIAGQMKISKSTVENYMVTALNHLRSSYQKSYKPTT